MLCGSPQNIVKEIDLIRGCASSNVVICLGSFFVSPYLHVSPRWVFTRRFAKRVSFPFLAQQLAEMAPDASLKRNPTQGLRA